ncbi:MAG: hypothetical protein AAGH78_14450 [Cyanobacteria bacterium P01_H01_bin.58]
MSFVNIKEMSFFGLRRSGNHAVQNWVIRQNNSSFVHLNDCKLYGKTKNPYENFSKVTISGINPLIYHQGLLKYRRYLQYLLNPEVEYLYGRNRPELNRGNLRNYHSKSLLLHGYEHYSLDQVIGDWFETQRDGFVGKSQQRFDVVILRDPFNVFASLIHRGEDMDKVDSISRKWVEHAREYLGLTNHFKNRVCISYNQWFTDKGYRQQIAKSLDLNFSDAGINTVVNVGHGSSFDGTTYDGIARAMPVLVRYKKYLEHPAMQRVLAHEELRDLADKIFGPIV